MCAFRFLIAWHQHNLPSRVSWLEPRKANTGSKMKKILIFLALGPFAFFVIRDDPMVAFHSVLILANTAIVTGGSYLAGADVTDPTSHDTQVALKVSKITRTAGQSVFLACNTLLLGILLVTIRNNRRDGDSRGKKSTVHPTLILLLIAWFPLIIRGIFGVLQSAVFDVRIDFIIFFTQRAG
jgi:hypothetical protein